MNLKKSQQNNDEYKQNVRRLGKWGIIIRWVRLKNHIIFLAQNVPNNLTN